jgi:hypothetical protein
MGGEKSLPNRAILSLMPLCKQSLKKLPFLIEQEVVCQQRESRQYDSCFRMRAGSLELMTLAAAGRLKVSVPKWASKSSENIFMPLEQFAPLMASWIA